MCVNPTHNLCVCKSHTHTHTLTHDYWPYIYFCGVKLTQSVLQVKIMIGAGNSPFVQSCSPAILCSVGPRLCPSAAAIVLIAAAVVSAINVFVLYFPLAVAVNCTFPLISFKLAWPGLTYVGP